MEKRRRILQAVLLTGACAMIAYDGLVSGEGLIVLHKAVRICMECIGLG